MMSRWKEAQTAFEQGKAQWQGVQQQMTGVGTDGIMEVGSLLSLNSQKPGVEWLAEMQRRLAEVTDCDPEVCRIKTELAEIEDTVQNYRDFLRNYRMQKESFRRLIKSCVDNSLDLEAYVASVEDWRQVRELLIESPLFEVQLVKEFVALDCIFQILYYMAGPNGSEHNKYKSQISYLISKWDVEDLLVEQEFSAKLLDNFFSNSKNRFSMLGKREMSAHSSPNQTNSESFLVVKKKLSLPFTTFTPVKESAIKLRNDCLHSDDLTSTKRLSGKLDWSKASTRLTNMDAHIQYDYNRQLADMSKSLTDMSYNELCDTVKNKDIEEQQKVLKELIARNYDKSRNYVKEKLMEVLRAEYSEGLVKFYSDKLESEIFALYYYCLDTYKSNAEKCAENLRFILNNQETLDCVMTTSIDFNMLAKKISDMNDGESEAMDGERYAIYRGRDDFADIMSEPVERNPPSDGSDGIEGYRRLPQKMDLEEEFELPDQIEEKTMSFEFLEELTKVREDEIKKLKGILLNIQQENQLLKDALVEVKGHLIALESTELELDLKVER